MSGNDLATVALVKPKRVEVTIELDYFLYERPVKLDGVVSSHVELVLVYVLNGDPFLVDGVEFRSPGLYLAKEGKLKAWIVPESKDIHDAHVQRYLKSSFFYDKSPKSISCQVPGMVSKALKAQGYKETSSGKVTIVWVRWMPPGLPEDSNLLRPGLRETIMTATAE